MSQTLEEILKEIETLRANATPALLAVIETAKKRDDVIPAMAEALNPYSYQPNWNTIHAAIEAKWSKSAIQYITNEAQKLRGNSYGRRKV